MARPHRNSPAMRAAVPGGETDRRSRSRLRQPDHARARRRTRASRSSAGHGKLGRTWPLPTSRPRRTSTRSSRTGSAARPASTCPATRRATAPTSACAPRSAGRRSSSTSRRTSTASTSGPAPTPFERAEQLAAEAYGAARSWFLTNGATQGNHALCLALAPLGAPVVVQRNAHASVIDGLVLSGGLPTWVAPEYEPGLGMAHGVTPEIAAAALDTTPDARAAFIVSPTYYGMAADVAGCAEVAHAARRAARRRPVVGARTSAFTPTCRRTRCQPGRRRDAHLDAQDRRLADAIRAAARVAAPAASTPDQIARTLRLMRSTSPSSLLMLLARRRAPPARAARRGAAGRHDRRLAGARPRRSTAIPGCHVVGDETDRPPGRGASRPAADRDRCARHRRDGLCGRDLAALELRHACRARHAGDVVLVLGIDEQPRELERFTHDLTSIV